jgi:hypothetical protein
VYPLLSDSNITHNATDTISTTSAIRVTNKEILSSASDFDIEKLPADLITVLMAGQDINVTVCAGVGGWEKLAHHLSWKHCIKPAAYPDTVF